MAESCQASNVHHLVLAHGREKAREMLPARQRSLVDIAAEVLADEQQRIGISYTGFCLTSLPHRRLPDDQVWRKEGHKVVLLVEPGHVETSRGIKQFGVPFGARARMILLFLQSEAVRTGSPEVTLGRSMRAWLEQMDISYGGETARALREQATRISACTLRFFWQNEAEGSRGFKRAAIIDSGLQFASPTHETCGQGTLWEESVILDATFWKALREHPVPLREAAIRQLRDRSMSLDVYVWLAWRLHTLTKPISISWPALNGQFGSGFRELRHFRQHFTEAIGAALAAYPEARVSVEDAGIVLYPSRPPVAKNAPFTIARG
jgi:hypothetical protein